MSFVDHLRVDVELDWLAESATDPQTGHVYHDVVARVGLRELGELPAGGLLGVVDVVCVVIESGTLNRYVDLSQN